MGAALYHHRITALPTQSSQKFTRTVRHVQKAEPPPPQSPVASAPLIQSCELFQGSFKFYGMGTFNLAWSIGDADAYGHVGDTYGYQSQTTYIPGFDFVVSATSCARSSTTFENTSAKRLCEITT